MLRSIIIIILSFLTLLISCNSGEIPSYVAVNNIKVETTNAGQGSTFHNISDCWLTVNGKLIGTFEVPFQVPVLETGKHVIFIEPGIKNNMSHTDRKVYPMLEPYIIDTFLYEGEVLTLEPVFRYKDNSNIKYAFIEDFEGIGHGFVDNERMEVTDNGAREGNCLHIVLDDENRSFEAKTRDVFPISETGEAYLEIDFKCNDLFVFGLFSREISGGSILEIRKEIFTFRPTNVEWRKAYIHLNYAVRTAQGKEFRPYFLSVRPENSKTDKTEFFIDNVKLIYW